MTRRVRIPAAVVFSVAIAVFGSAAFALASALVTRSIDLNIDEADFTSLARWQMFMEGASLASTLLLAGALFGIANRLSRWQRTIVLISAWLQLVWLGWTCARPVLFQLITDPDLMDLAMNYVWRLMLIGMFASFVLLTVAARAWWRPHSAFVVIAAVVLVLLETIAWAPYIAVWFHSLNYTNPLLYRVLWPLREIISDGALLVVIHALMRDAIEPLPDPNAATSWFRRAEASLITRVIVAILLALIGLSKAPGAVNLIILAGPLIAVATLLGFGWCMLGVERAAIVGMPRIRLLLGATVAAWMAGLQLLQATTAYSMVKSDGFRGGAYNEEMTTTWSILGPLIGITGMVLVCSAVARFAAIRGEQALREIAISRAIIFCVLNGVVMLLPLAFEKVTSTGTLIMLSLLIAGAAIAALMMLAGVMRKAAEAIGTAPQLPVARLR